jgi:ABC-type glycerol-3-phosphate transport system substrate-binding protein
MEERVTMADVFFASSWEMQPEFVRAGYYLDLTPLIESDPEFNADDFFPAALESFRWDGGLWALPTSVSLQFVMYDETAFNQAGLPLPRADWTLDDYVLAAEEFVTIQDGQTFSGVFINQNMLIDPAALEGPDGRPLVTDPAVLEVMQRFRDLREEGLINSYGPNSWMAPVTSGSISSLTSQPPDPEAENYNPVLVPGTAMVGGVDGLGISGGTRYPELAYELIKFIIETPQITERMGGELPALRSQFNTTTETPFWALLEADAETLAMAEEALETAVPFSEIRYFNYLWRIDPGFGPGQGSEEVDLVTAAQEAQADIDTMFALAEERRQRGIVAEVAPPAPPPDLAPGETVLDFSLDLYNYYENEQQWNDLVEAFVAETPSVGAVNLEIDYSNTEEVLEEFDCFYMPYNALGQFEPQDLLNVDPFLDADPTYDVDDVLPGVIDQLQMDGMTYAIPLTIQPRALYYDSVLFESLGIPAPIDGWTIGEFVMALREAQPAMPEGVPVFETMGGPSGMDMLVAAFGGMPLDMTTEPPTLNFTEPQTVDAIREALNLYDEGLIQYYGFSRPIEGGGFGGGGGGNVPMEENAQGPAVMAGEITAGGQFFGRFGPMGQEQDTPYQPTSYPTGSRYTPVEYNVTAAYINANADDPQACYNFISRMAQHPEFFDYMPARASLLDMPELAASHGEDVVSFYRDFANRLRQPNTITPASFMSRPIAPAFYTTQYWLLDAYDDYLQEDNFDLEAGLAEAERKANVYLECAEPLEAPTDPTNQDAWMSYQESVEQCAFAADPDLEEQVNQNR